MLLYVRARARTKQARPDSSKDHSCTSAGYDEPRTAPRKLGALLPTLALLKHTRKPRIALMASLVCGFLSIVSMLLIDPCGGRDSAIFSGMLRATASAATLRDGLSHVGPREGQFTINSLGATVGKASLAAGIAFQ